MRRAIGAVILVAGSAAADDTCPTAPANATIRKLELVYRVNPDTASKEVIFALAAGSELPAISEDGKLMAALLEDSDDGTGAKTSHLVVWSRSGKVVTEIEVGWRTGAPPKTLAAANAALATTRWRPIATFSPCGDPMRLPFGGGLVVALDAKRNQLSRVKPAATLAGKFPPLGTRQGIGGHCGELTGLGAGFGEAAFGLVVLIPRVSLGGDNCVGASYRGLAIAVPIPR